MTALAKDTRGTILRLAAAPGVPAVVAELTSITPPALTRGTIDATTHDGATEAMEFIADGVYDPGEITCEGHLILGSTADDLFVAALTSGNVYNFEVEAKGTGSTREEWTGQCIITAYTPGDMPVAGAKQTFSATMKVTGAITQAAVV